MISGEPVLSGKNLLMISVEISRIVMKVVRDNVRTKGVSGVHLTFAEISLTLREYYIRYYEVYLLA